MRELAYAAGLLLIVINAAGLSLVAAGLFFFWRFITRDESVPRLKRGRRRQIEPQHMAEVTDFAERARRVRERIRRKTAGGVA